MAAVSGYLALKHMNYLHLWLAIFTLRRTVKLLAAVDHGSTNSHIYANCTRDAKYLL